MWRNIRSHFSSIMLSHRPSNRLFSMVKLWSLSSHAASSLMRLTVCSVVDSLRGSFQRSSFLARAVLLVACRRCPRAACTFQHPHRQHDVHTRDCVGAGNQPSYSQRHCPASDRQQIGQALLACYQGHVLTEGLLATAC